MDVEKGTMFYILMKDNQFSIPVYQRCYSWGREQCERLWNDMVTMQKKGKNGHFIGSIVSIGEQTTLVGVQKFMLIDGQQRMTTLTLLLVALRDYVEKNPNDESIKAELINNMLLNKCGNGNERYKLLLTERDRDILLKLIDKKSTKHTKSKLIDNYNFFVKRIEEKKILPSKICESFKKLQIVNIILDKTDDDAQAVFESLNSTGKKLSEADLIRNYLLMGLEPTEQTYVYEHLWRPMEELFTDETQDDLLMDKFFRDYLTMKQTRIPKQGRVYEEFKLYHFKCEFATIRELCADILAYAGYYTDIVYKRGNNKILKSLYDDIVELKMEISYPFLLKVHDDLKNNIISENDFFEILKLCISYVVRRSICEIPANSLNKTFATLKNYVHSDDYLNSIKAFFILCEGNREFPGNDKFTDAFVAKDMYNMRLRKFILGHLENFNKKDHLVQVENYSIEHIMPQNKNLSEEWKSMLGENWKDIQDQYLHTIGNLTLTDYNSEMGDRPFMIKMDMENGYKESALKLNAFVIKQTVWNEESIKERARLLSEKAKNIWAFPVMKEDDLAPYQVEKAAESITIDTYNPNELTKKLFYLLNQRILNLSPEVKRELKKKYVAYKLDTNFADIQFQNNKLFISVNMKFFEVNDPKGICRDLTDLGHWGNGDVGLYMKDTREVGQVMNIIEQAYRRQDEE